MARHVVRFAAWAWAWAAFAAPALAQPVVSIDTTAGAGRVANALGVGVADLERQLQTEMRALFGLLDVEDFLRLSANAQTLVSAGIGADYTASAKGFFVGFGVNAAVDAGEGDLTDPSFDLEREVPASAGAMITLVAGYNLAEQGLPWMTLSAHAMHFPMNVGQFEGDFTNVGGHIQLSAFRQLNPAGVTFLRWGGIDFTTGFTYARTTLNLIENYEANTALSADVRLETLSVGTLQLEQTAYTIPIEVTTSVTIIELLSLYGGLGLDIPLGDASAQMDLETQLVGRVDGEPIEMGTATIQVDARGDADDLLPRAMVGLQLNLWILRAFAQLSISMRDTALGLATGIRVMF